MVKKLLLVSLWFPLTFLLLVLNLGLLTATAHWDHPAFPISAASPGESSFAAAGGTSQVLSATVTAGGYVLGVSVLR